eukprot:940552-Prorocentrum_minimum.AAC.3
MRDYAEAYFSAVESPKVQFCQNMSGLKSDVIFYDLGFGSAVASLVRFSSFKGKEFGKVKNFGQFEVKAVTWDATAGVGDLDMLLVEHFADEFNQKLNGDDVRKYPKNDARQWLSIRRNSLLSCDLPQFNLAHGILNHFPRPHKN